MSTAKELRGLASGIEQLCLKAPCLSVAWPVVQNCVDHLTALAAVHEKTLALAERGARGMFEIDNYRMRSGDMLVLLETGLGKWIVSRYSRSDIEEWSNEFFNRDEAVKVFEQLREEDRAQQRKAKKRKS